MASPSASELGAAISGVIGHGTLQAAYQNRADLYEVYLWAAVVKAAADEGASFAYKTASGSATPPFTFRKGPGRIATAGSPYVHAELTFGNRPPLEVHQGIYVSGTSLNRHECDVVVLKRDECDRARATPGGNPRSSAAVIAIEAKLYGPKIGMSIARGFVGLKQDLWMKKPGVFLVTNSDMSLVARYLNRHDFRWQEDVSPSANRAPDFISAVKRRFQVYRTS